MARNWYAEAIDVVSEDKDFKRIVIEIAKSHPKCVVMADTRVYGKAWRERCRELYLNGDKIPAIKLWREKTKASLKEAKEAVERLG